MKLHKDKVIFKELIKLTADYYFIPEHQVEKDYLVSLFLSELKKTSRDIDFVFKGGTSLSKAFQVVKRFSEDIDLTVLTKVGNVTAGQRKKVKDYIVQTSNALEMNIINIDETRSRRDHNIYKIMYDKEFEFKNDILEYIILETIVVYKPYPTETKKINNLITTFLNENKRIDIIKKYNLEPFEMLVQSLVRTLVDKLFALCDYHLENKYDRYSRHLYDIHKIWTSKENIQEEAATIIYDVIKDRQLFGDRNLSAQAGRNPNEILNEIINTASYKKDFESVTSKLTQDNVTYYDCIKSLKEIINIKLLPDKIQQY